MVDQSSSSSTINTRNTSTSRYSTTSRPDEQRTTNSQEKKTQATKQAQLSQEQLKRYQRYLKSKQIQSNQQTQQQDPTPTEPTYTTSNSIQENYPYHYPDVEIQDSRIAPGMKRPIPEQTVLEWTALSRVFKKKNKKYFSTIIVIAALISLILFFAGQMLPVAVVIAIVFLIYVLSVVEPPKIKYKITNYGIHIAEETYYWLELGRFWLEKKDGFNIVNVELGRFPNRLAIILPAEYRPEIMKALLSEVLLNEKPELTTYEKVAQWLQEKIPIETG